MTHLQKIIGVARWEFVEKARTKAFVISILLTPIMMAVFGTLPSILASREDTDTKRFAVYDETSSLVQPAQERLAQKYKLSNGKLQYELVPVDVQSMSVEQFRTTFAARVFNGDFTGMFIVPKDVARTYTLEYRSDNVGNVREINRIERELQQEIAERFANAQGISKEVYEGLTKSLSTSTIKISKTGEAKESGFLQTFGTLYASILISFLLIIYTGQMLVRGLMEEKSNRIMEILVSSCSPFELMMGKLIGLSGLGVIQGVAWIGMGIGALAYFGGPVQSVLQNLPLTLLYTLLGYLLFASLLLGIGSLTTTEQEAQQITGYVSLFAMAPLIIIFPILQNPNGTIARILSFFPLTTSATMIARSSVVMPAWWEIALTLVLLLVSILFVTYLAAKLFRVGILVYGKRPTLPEVLSFLREPS
jgi:ABC-2 type transport system permease protein